MITMVEEIAETIIRVLKSQGVIIQRYDAYSTQSIYLKLDYGVAHTIRISDHRGKKHLKYKYNLQTNLQERRYDNKNEQMFYPANEVYELIRKVLINRAKRQKRYGKRYQQYMNKNLMENSNKRGFWKEAKLV